MTSAQQAAVELHEQLTDTEGRLIAEADLEGGSGNTLHLTGIGYLTSLWLAEGWYCSRHIVTADPDQRDALILLPYSDFEDFDRLDGFPNIAQHIELLPNSDLPDEVEVEGFELQRLATVLGIAYRAIRDGEVSENVHPFLTPVGLYASTDLQLVHGHFTITGRGIEDTEAG